MTNKATGKYRRQGSSSKAVFKLFPDSATAEKWFAERRWGDTPICPHCGSVNIQSHCQHKTMPYRCREKQCAKRFSVKIGTVMEGSNLDYQVWAVAMYLMLTNHKGISSMKLQRELYITQKAAWHLAHRLRKGLQAGSDRFSGAVEANNIYIEGKCENISNSKGVMVYSDEASAYNGLAKPHSIAQALGTGPLGYLRDACPENEEQTVAVSEVDGINSKVFRDDRPLSTEAISSRRFLFNRIVAGDARKILKKLPADSVDLSFWSPPYYVGKSYEKGWTFNEWQSLIHEVIARHTRILKSGGFLVVNIADILCFADPDMPKFQADNVNGKKHKVTREDVLQAKRNHPDANRHELARLLGCSEQTVQRRLENNNVRGGKHETATKVLLTGGMVSQWAEDSGLYLYDRRIWHKDPCWANSRWHSASYKAVDEFEHLYIFWKPGIVSYERTRLTTEDWAQWGSRAVWKLPSVRRNHRHEAEFPEELAERVISLFSPSGGTVIDPFVGSGTTTSVARRLGRTWLGIDISCQFANMAKERTDGV